MKGALRTALVLGGLLVMGCGTLWAQPTPPAIPTTTYTVGTYAHVTSVLTNGSNYLWIEVQGGLQPECPGPAMGIGQVLTAENWAAEKAGRSEYELTDERTKALMKVALASLLSKQKVKVLVGACLSASSTHRRVFGASLLADDGS